MEQNKGILETSAEVLLLAELDKVISEYLEANGYGEESLVGAHHLCAIQAAIAWLEYRWLD